MKSWFSQLNLKSALMRLPFVAISILCTSFGISCYYACALGADPISVFVDGQHQLFSLTYGQVTTINNLILVTLMFIFARRYFNIGTIVSCFLTGPLIDLFEGALRNAFPAESAPVWVKIAMLLTGVLVLGAGAGLFVATDLGVGAFDFPPLVVRDRTGWKLSRIRIVMDAMYVAVGWLMGGIVGIGTIVGVLLTGPVLSFALGRIKPPLEKLCGPLRRESEKVEKSDL